MLLMLQVARNAAGPVHVIVDSVPKPADWPEWAKLLVSASVGAVLALGGNLFIEWIRPRMSRHASRELVKQHINEEFLRNRNKVFTAQAIIRDANAYRGRDGFARRAISGMLYRMPMDRHEEFFASEKAMVYEIDPEGDLMQFYSIAKQDLPKAIMTGNLDLVMSECENLMVYAGKYSIANELPAPIADEVWMNFYWTGVAEATNADVSG